MQSTSDKHASSYTPSNSNNPKFIVKYTSKGAVRVQNPSYDPKACTKCGKRHGWFGGCK